jgi:hypothetical protein
MVDPSAVKAYLTGISCRYERWRQENALTDTIAEGQATFTFEQFVQTEEKRQGERPEKIMLPLFKGIRNYLDKEHVLLVGSPGVGKSSALWQCLNVLAQEELEATEPRIPVLVQLKGFTNSDNPFSIQALIRTSIGLRLRLSDTDIEDLLCDKRLILLLDGLNEMPAGSSRTHLKAFCQECQDLEVPLICSTRELYGGDLGIQRKLEIQPLNPREIERFLQECLPEHQDQVRQLLQRDNRDLSRTPFVLWMLYHLLKETGTIANSLGEAFRQFFRYHFRNYKEDVPVPEERRKDWNLWMEHLAFSMLSSPDPLDPGLVISEEEAESKLIDRFGKLQGQPSRIEELKKYHLLTSVSDREISFKHQLIQEYYAAEEILRCLLENNSDLVDDHHFKCKYLNYMKWTEPLSLTIALINSEAHAMRIVRLAIETDLFLGSRISEDLQPIFREKGSRFLSEQKIPDWLRSELAISRRNSNGFNSVSTTKLKHRSFYEKDWGEFLPNLLNFLQKGDYTPQEVCSHSLEIVAMALAQADYKPAIPSLIQLLESDKIQLQWSIPYALGLMGAEDSIPGLLKSLDNERFYIRWSAADVLEQLESVKAIPGLLKALENKDSYVQGRAANGLKRFHGNFVVHILPNLYQLMLTASKETASMAFSTYRVIQNKCQFYNYKIYTKSREIEVAEFPGFSPIDRIDKTTQEIHKRITKMESKPKNDFKGASFNGPVNFGDNPTGDFINTQNNYSAEERKALDQLSQLVERIRAKYPNASEQEILEKLVQGFENMPKQNPKNWQKWRDLLSVLFAGGLETVKAVEPFTAIPIVVLTQLYEIYNRNRKQLPDK